MILSAILSSFLLLAVLPTAVLAVAIVIALKRRTRRNDG